MERLWRGCGEADEILWTEDWMGIAAVAGMDLFQPAYMDLTGEAEKKLWRGCEQKLR